MACIRLPSFPHAPTGSILLSFDLTIIFDLSPGYLEMEVISIMPSSISGTSNSNNLYKK